MRNRLTMLLAWLVGFALTVTLPDSLGANERFRLEREVGEALTALAEVCQEAWKYDNLRPAMRRTKWLEATVSSLPEGPVVHLSAGSPYYRRLVGQIAYCGSLYVSRVARLAEFTASEEGRQVPDAPPEPQHGSAVEEEIPGAKKELDHAVASYMRACAWAWPYGNLRPLCQAPGLEPATFLNPLIPVPDGRIRLSQANPDYALIVASLREMAAANPGRPDPARRPAGGSASRRVRRGACPR